MRGRRPNLRPARRLSLLVRFAIISFVLLLAVGVVLGRWFGHIQEQRALDDGVRAAELVAQAAIQPKLTPDAFDGGFRPLDAALRAELDAQIGRATGTGSLVRVKVWNAQHWIVYSDNSRLIGRWFVGDPALDQALAGTTNSLITDLSRPEEMEERAEEHGRLLAVYVPLRVDDSGLFTNDGTGTVVGAFEIYVPYGPIATALAHDLRLLWISLAAGLVALYLGLFRLVARASSKLRRQAAVNEHQATHDHLTGLPNRQQLVTELQRMLDRRHGTKYVALALVDIDRFKEINDALGHPSGDAVLISIAERFRVQMPDAVVARIGGDEFAIAADHLPHAQASLAVATRIEEVLHDPFEVAGISVSVRPSIGIALGPDDGRTAEELLQHADVAMYVAKREGSVRRLYSRNLDHYSPDRLQLAGELRDAIAEANGEVHLAFQPKLDLRTDEISGVECLVRWKHPQRGFVPPAEFLPIIENTELIAPLTWLVLDQALATCASWHRHGIETTMAVNISARTIGSPELYDRVAAALEQHGLPPAALELELTESALLGDHHLAAANVARLRELGVGIAIDDFGTGYASIGYLTTMPISAVKIDGSFVDRMFSDEASAAVVNFSLGLGKQLGLVVVAEGIEDESTLEELRRLGCDQGQGYFISRPLGSTEFLHWLLAWSTRHLTPRDVAPELADRFLASQPSYRGPGTHRPAGSAHDAHDTDDGGAGERGTGVRTLVGVGAAVGAAITGEVAVSPYDLTSAPPLAPFTLASTPYAMPVPPEAAVLAAERATVRMPLTVPPVLEPPVLEPPVLEPPSLEAPVLEAAAPTEPVHDDHVLDDEVWGVFEGDEGELAEPAITPVRADLTGPAALGRPDPSVASATGPTTGEPARTGPAPSWPSISLNPLGRAPSAPRTAADSLPSMSLRLPPPPTLAPPVSPDGTDRAVGTDGTDDTEHTDGTTEVES